MQPQTIGTIITASHASRFFLLSPPLLTASFNLGVCTDRCLYYWICFSSPSSALPHSLHTTFSDQIEMFTYFQLSCRFSLVFCLDCVLNCCLFEMYSLPASVCLCLLCHCCRCTLVSNFFLYLWCIAVTVDTIDARQCCDAACFSTVPLYKILPPSMIINAIVELFGTIQSYFLSFLLLLFLSPSLSLSFHCLIFPFFTLHMYSIFVSFRTRFLPPPSFPLSLFPSFLILLFFSCFPFYFKHFCVLSPVHSSRKWMSKNAHPVLLWPLFKG